MCSELVARCQNNVLRSWQGNSPKADLLYKTVAIFAGGVDFRHASFGPLFAVTGVHMVTADDEPADTTGAQRANELLNVQQQSVPRAKIVEIDDACLADVRD